MNFQRTQLSFGRSSVYSFIRPSYVQSLYLRSVILDASSPYRVVLCSARRVQDNVFTRIVFELVLNTSAVRSGIKAELQK